MIEVQTAIHDTFWSCPSVGDISVGSGIISGTRGEAIAALTPPVFDQSSYSLRDTMIQKPTLVSIVITVNPAAVRNVPTSLFE